MPATASNVSDSRNRISSEPVAGTTRADREGGARATVSELQLEPAARRRRSLFAFIAVGLLLWLDLWSKAAVFAWLESGQADLVRDIHGHERYPILGGWLTFMTNRNFGAAFGQLDNIPYLLVGGRSVAALVLAWLIIRAPRGQRAYFVALVLILSGALGNLYDNLFRPLDPGPDRVFGPVRDFIDVYFYSEAWSWDWHFPTFNVADSCISVGAVLLLASGFLSGDQEQQADPKDASGATDDAAA